MGKFDKQIVETKIRKMEQMLHELHSFLESRIEHDVIYPASEKTWQGIAAFKKIISE